jgi:hypothetical protein
LGIRNGESAPGVWNVASLSAKQRKFSIRIERKYMLSAYNAFAGFVPRPLSFVPPRLAAAFA